MVLFIGIPGESRADTGLERELFCSAGAAGVRDPSDYAGFMRAGFRSGHFIAVFLQVEPGQIQHLGIVINDQNFCFAHHTLPYHRIIAAG